MHRYPFFVPSRALWRRSAAVVLALCAGAHAAPVRLHVGGAAPELTYVCTLIDGRAATVVAPTRGRAWKACQAWAAAVGSPLKTVLRQRGAAPVNVPRAEASRAALAPGAGVRVDLDRVSGSPGGESA